jgi:hypothetical protein
MPSFTDALFIATFSKVFAILHACNYQLAQNAMDKECSKVVEKHIRSNKMDIKLIPPHHHHVTTIQHAIATFKEHFVAILATVDMICLQQLWDEFLPQVELSLNLLRFSCLNPHVSANQELYSPFNFNKTPLAPLGTKALVYDNLAIRASWAPHATDSFYIGSANDHCHCLCFYIPSSWCFHFAVLVCSC